jgi:hypothetical protein
MTKRASPRWSARVQLFVAVGLSLCAAGLFIVAALGVEDPMGAVASGASLAGGAVVAWLQYGQARKRRR